MAEVLVLALSDRLLLWVYEFSFEVLTEAEVAYVDELDFCAELVELSDSDAFWLLLAEAFKLAFADFDEEFDADLLAEALRLAPNVPAALAELAEVLDALSVPWLDEPPLLAVVLLDALPELAEEAPPPDELLLSVELPEVPAELGFWMMVVGVVEAVFLVELEVDVSLLLFDPLAEAFREAPSVPAALELAELFAEDASVVARDALALFDADSVSL